MVYAVERYSPGRLHSDVLRGLSRLATQESEPSGVRPFGSTIVFGDGACFCQFEGPTSAAVAEANRRAGLPFDRIVPAVTVQPERRNTMSMSTTIPTTVQIKRTNLIGLVALAAVLAAAATWLVLEFAIGTGRESARASVPAVTVQSESPEEQSVGAFLFGPSGPLTAAQRQAVRDNLVGAALPMSPTEARSIGTFLFGTSGPLSRAQLQTVRNYWLGASSPGSTAEQASGPTSIEADSIATYLFGHSAALTPQQRRMVSYYWLAAASQ